MNLLKLAFGVAMLAAFIMTVIFISIVVKWLGIHVGQEIGWSFGYALIAFPLLAWWSSITPPVGREDWLKSR